VLREPLDGGADPLAAVGWLRGEPRPVALSGDWAGGGLLLSSHPLLTPAPDADPFALLDALPFELDPAGEAGAIGGGWFGWLGFGLARELEPVPPPPPRPHPLPRFDLAFHDHLVRCDGEGRWWFEALWTEARAELLRTRLEQWRARLAGPPPAPGPLAVSALRIAAPGAAGHVVAVAEVVDRIAAGDLSQANVCLTIEGELLDGDGLELWTRAVTAVRPARAAYVGGERHAVASLSPELFLRRQGRSVETRPIKGTAPAGSDPAALAASAKDRAENVMIVDLMRNDLGRVCEYGSVEVTGLYEVEPAAGVLHLVSTVRGTLRPEVGDGALLRASFPPGSVTGAPKVQALRLIHAVEPRGREAYCGAVGFRSPLAGLELNVAIRTFELRGERLWLGAGGGIVSDSVPEAEADEALAKAAGVAAAAGLWLAPAQPRRRLRPPPLVRLARPDPALGLLETIGVSDGRPVALAAHLARLRAGCAALGIEAPRGLEELIAAAGPLAGGVRLRLDGSGVELSARDAPGTDPVALRPVTLPGGLGVHKWADRSLIDALSTPGSTPLFCDLDGTVLEAGYAAVLIALGDVLVAPPLDGRLLPSVSRELALRAARRAGFETRVAGFTLAEARAARGLVLTSSLRGAHPGVLASGPAPAASAVICEALRRWWGINEEEVG
jgi:para-aminobenzoate synthetase/4-amino-4-deoxychorismate lyase